VQREVNADDSGCCILRHVEPLDVECVHSKRFVDDSAISQYKSQAPLYAVRRSLSIHGLRYL
jgi:hypothetical protein